MTTHHILMQGMKGCWPSPQSSTEICKLAVTLHRKTLPEKSMVGVERKTLLRRIARLVHPDIHLNAGPRLFYIALASNTLIQRCMESIDNKDIQDQRAMPRLIITQFTLENSAHFPPSKFEYAMARYREIRSDCIAGDLYQNHGHETRDVGSLRCVRAAEETFWRNACVAAKPIDTIFFREFVRKWTTMELKVTGDLEPNSHQLQARSAPTPTPSRPPNTTTGSGAATRS